MDNIYKFIDKGLSVYNSLHIADFSSEILQVCQELNCLLNKDVQMNYAKHLENNTIDINNKINLLFCYLSGNLFINANNLFELLFLYQENSRINKDYYRDHYYHSIQCFLLGLSLYALMPVFQNKCNSWNKNCLNITTVFFDLFLYHDLGYLYSTTEADRINETVRAWFINIDSDNISSLKRICNFFSMNFSKNVIADFSNKIKLKEIWKQPYNETDKSLIEEKFCITKASCDVEAHHSYESAIMLYRLVRTRELLLEPSQMCLPAGTIDITPDEQKNQFIEVIRAVLFHDFSMQSKLTLSNNFLACFLMIVDEIQHYGRSYQNEEYNKKILLPTKVGLEITSAGKIKLLEDAKFIKSLEKDVRSAYKEYSMKNIYTELSKKIDKKDLKSIF